MDLIHPKSLLLQFLRAQQALPDLLARPVLLDLPDRLALRDLRDLREQMGQTVVMVRMVVQDLRVQQPVLVRQAHLLVLSE